MVLPAELVQPFVDAKYAADLGSNAIDQIALAHLIDTGQLDRHLRHAASTYRNRRDRLVTRLTTALPDWHIEGTAAGLHLLLHPSDPARNEADVERALADLAQRSGLDARPLADFSIDASAKRGLVVGYGHQRADTLEYAVQDLAKQLASAEQK